jgi:hypothetical protein
VNVTECVPSESRLCNVHEFLYLSLEVLSLGEFFTIAVCKNTQEKNQ